MFPHVTEALRKLSRTHKLELRTSYNVDQFGELDLDLFGDTGITATSVPWSEAAYEEHFPDMDIGRVPNLIHVPHTKESGIPFSLHSRWFNEHSSDRLLRYKNTANVGRAFVFAQYGIPVVSDFTERKTQQKLSNFNRTLVGSRVANTEIP